ncbi:fatty acid-2 hydroxylase [Lentinula raphanica]|nr:fatty acid-2 hydroxylase [Lentinula raphanica]
MEDKPEHGRSDSAYDMLDEYAIGRLGCRENIVRNGSRSHIHWEAEDDFDPDATDAVEDLKKHQFLDLHFASAFVKCKLQSPKPNGVRCQYSGYISFYLFLRSALQFITPLPSFMVDPTSPLSALANLSADSLSKTLMCFFIGHFIWTLLEYIFNRFVDYYLPNKPIFTLTTLAARLHLIMPPLLFAILEWPMTCLANKISSLPVANGINIGGVYYVLYDCMHYALNYTQLLADLKEMKKYHLAHRYHYQNFNLEGKFWDIVFNTVLPV